MTRRGWLTIAVGGVLGQAACAHARTDPRTLFLTPWSPPSGQRCAVNKQQVPLPDRVFDTVALNRAVAPLGPGRVVVALAFWPGDTAWHEEYGPRPDSMAVVESTLPESAGVVVRAALLEAVKRPIRSRLLIRLDLNDGPRLQLAPALECPPAIRSQADLRRYTAALRSVGAPPGRALLQFLVRPDGGLTAFAIHTSSGDDDFDRAALSVVPFLHFTPGLINHVPVLSLVRFPVEVRATRRGPPPPPTATDCPRGRVVEIANPLTEAVAVYAFTPTGAELLGTVDAGLTARLALPPASSGYGFVHWADAAAPHAQDRDLNKVRWTVKCGVP